jgi:hypothetical protein
VSNDLYFIVANTLTSEQIDVMMRSLKGGVMRNAALFLVSLVLLSSCGDPHRPRGNPAPVQVTTGAQSVTANMPDQRLFTFEITNVSSQALTLDKIDCTMQLTFPAPATHTITGEWRMVWRSKEFRTQRFQAGAPFGLFFYGEHLAAGETLQIEIYGTVSGCQPGEQVLLTRNYLQVRSYDQTSLGWSTEITCNY